jgi:hypothetical protein
MIDVIYLVCWPAAILVKPNNSSGLEKSALDIYQSIPVWLQRPTSVAALAPCPVKSMQKVPGGWVVVEH